MHLRSHYLPGPSASSPLDNRAYPMANTIQVPDLEGLHYEIHGDHSQNHSIGQEWRERHRSLSPAPPRGERSLSPQKNASHLFTVHQKEIEHLEDYVKRFNQAILEVEDLSDKMVIMALIEGLHLGPLFDSLSKNVPEPLSTLQNKDDKYITMELVEAKRRRRGKDDPKRKEHDNRRSEYRDETRNKKSNRDSRQTNERHPRTPPQIKHEEFVKWPEKIKIDPSRRNKNKYCKFHRDHRHNTEDCFQLKEQIADLIKKGYLRKYVANCQPPNSPERRYGENRPTARDIQVTHGVFRFGGCTSSSRKRHVRNGQGRAEEEVYNLSSPVVEVHPSTIFNNNDLRGLHLPHDDALVISVVIANFNVQRILVDNGSSVNILFILAFDKMMIGLGKLHPFHTSLVEFGGNMTHPLGWIKLPVTLQTEPHQITIWQDFIVVDFPSPYNAILGCPTLGRTRSITSTYHLKMKFPTTMRVGEIKIYPPDMEKTSFITERGLYCYKVMPFVLKNVGATYQRLVNKIFKEQIGKTMEVYIDDMLVKSLQAADHIAHLEEAFGVLRNYRMMLNPSKCIFGVSSGKFLGFLVTNSGIKANPDQIQALIAMNSPISIHEVQQLTGRVVALNRFVSKSADKCLPFFRILRKNQAFQWGEESKTAFQQLKEYLGSPPLLSVLITSEELFLYLFVSTIAVSAVLIREDDRVQKPVYYVSKVLMGAETRYLKIEKLAYALMIAARKLRHNFQAHPIAVLTD
ncbi:hypothetical protein Acr_00g0059790 [Actinidia rufa]|uniref:Reverse transcriptase domain-containing protein n=1 Tax=Actinidia rufa TaxID=165716 RepID=A0A7J0DN68_9ERIC|nr:hypothetical protein Acr_00g0059790 [Actinidia rufa]